MIWVTSFWTRAAISDSIKFLNQNFHDYLCRQIETNHGAALHVEIKTPAEEKCLQAADIVSWSIFRKYEYADDRYYQLLKPIIVEKNPLYK